MQCVAREKLLSYISEVTGLVDLYQKRDPLFVAQVIRWMSEAERTFQVLRIPVAAVVSSERAKILAAADGYRDHSIGGQRISARKVTMATAAIGLSRVQDEMRRATDDINVKLEAWREKMAQFLAVATQKIPISLPPTDPREAWLAQTWKDLNVNGETQGMYRYLNATMQRTDRLYILDEVIGNLLDLW